MATIQGGGGVTQFLPHQNNYKKIILNKLCTCNLTEFFKFKAVPKFHPSFFTFGK